MLELRHFPNNLAEDFPFKEGMKLNGSLPHFNSRNLSKNLRPIVATTGSGYEHRNKGHAIGLWEYHSGKYNKVSLLSVEPRIPPFPDELAKIITGESLVSTEYFIVKIER